MGKVKTSAVCRVSDLIGRRDRCECAPTDVDVKRCFWLSFDQQAFVAAALKTDEQLRQMFNERLVWNDSALTAQMRMRGLVQRVYAPQVRLASCWVPAWRCSQLLPRAARLRTACAPLAACGHCTDDAVYAS